MLRSWLRNSVIGDHEEQCSGQLLVEERTCSYRAGCPTFKRNIAVWLDRLDRHVLVTIKWCSDVCTVGEFDGICELNHDALPSQ